MTTIPVSKTDCKCTILQLEICRIIIQAKPGQDHPIKFYFRIFMIWIYYFCIHHYYLISQRKIFIIKTWMIFDENDKIFIKEVFNDFLDDNVKLPTDKVG